MKRLVIAGVTLFIACSNLLFAQQLGPKILVVDPAFDFGFIPQNTKVSHSYWVNNLGTDTLRIFDVRPGCGCTKAPLTSFIAAPNDSLPIELVFDSGRRTRSQLKSTKVSCNDPVKGTFNLQLSAFVFTDEDTTGPIRITDNGVLKLTTDDRGKSFAVKFKNVSSQPVTVKLIDHPTELLSVEMPSGSIGAGKIGEIMVKVNTKLERDDYRKSFTFELSDKDKTRFTIPVRMAASMTSLQGR